jgi:hypothetical protein
MAIADADGSGQVCLQEFEDVWNRYCMREQASRAPVAGAMPTAQVGADSAAERAGKGWLHLPAAVCPLPTPVSLHFCPPFFAPTAMVCCGRLVGECFSSTYPRTPSLAPHRSPSRCPSSLRWPSRSFGEPMVRRPLRVFWRPF